MLRINLDAFLVAGGALLFLTALDIMRGAARVAPVAHEEASDVSFVPLGIPSLAGPGALTTVIVFSTDHSSGHSAHALILLGAITLVFALRPFVRMCRCRGLPGSSRSAGKPWYEEDLRQADEAGSF